MSFKIVFTILLIVAVSVSAYWSVVKQNLNLCLVRECCHENDGTQRYIYYDSGCENLLKDLKTKVYGQPLIISPIYRSIKAHLKDERPARPLVMYFGGWTGTGKTHVARLIAQNLFKEGMKSNFVKYISSTYHFPIKIEGLAEVTKYRNQLRDMIKETVRNCERSLIILDELDKLPSGIVDSIQPMVDYIDDVDGVRYNKAIFIFLSNTGADKLNKLAYEIFKGGKERKDLVSKEVEEILIKETYNEQGGLRRSSLLARYSIGVFIPFLPLERSHVRLCIRDEIQTHVIAGNNDTSIEEQDTLIDEIADEMAYFPEDTKLYSKSGCKGVHDKVINHFGPQISTDPQLLVDKEL